MWAQIAGAGLSVAGGLMAKRSRKKALRKMEKKAAETRERFERKASDARSSFRGSLRTVENLKTSSDIEFRQARTTAARLQKSALQNRQLARRGGGTPEQQAQMLGMGNMQEYLAERAGRFENVQRLTQMEAGIVSQQQQISAEILKTGAGAESVWNEAQAGLMSQKDEMAGAIAGMGSAMMGMGGGGGAAAAPAAAVQTIGGGGSNPTQSSIDYMQGGIGPSAAEDAFLGNYVPPGAEQRQGRIGDTVFRGDLGINSGLPDGFLLSVQR